MVLSLNVVSAAALADVSHTLRCLVSWKSRCAMAGMLNMLTKRTIVGFIEIVA